MRTVVLQTSTRQRLVEALLLGYKRAISPLFGDACRFSPTCAEYAAQAVVERGWWHGSILALRRVIRCHPLGGSGFDSVPSRVHSRHLRP